MNKLTFGIGYMINSKEVMNVRNLIIVVLMIALYLK